jgi:glycosyltransferase involved in cell wall biosynthesis
MADRPLHLAIDGRELAGRPTGVGRYLVEILRAWTRDASFPHRLSVILPSTPTPALRALDRVEWHVVEGRAGTWWEQARLPGALRNLGADVFFAAGYTAPIVRTVPFVVAIYDVSFFAHPEWFSWREGARRRWLSRRAAQRAATVITISNFSAAEIVRWMSVPRARIRLAPPGAPDIRWHRGAPRRDPVALHVGSLFNRRHIPDLIRGFARVVRAVPGARLVIVGDNRTRPRVDPRAEAERLGIAPAVDWREYVPEAELASLYGSARVFVFLSDYEGFAMTPMEALAAGAPPVLLDTPVSREVYGAGARYVSTEPESIGAALTDLLTDEAAREALLATGFRQMDQYSWARSAAVVQRALEDAVR